MLHILLQFPYTEVTAVDSIHTTREEETTSASPDCEKTEVPDVKADATPTASDDAVSIPGNFLSFEGLFEFLSRCLEKSNDRDSLQAAIHVCKNLLHNGYAIKIPPLLSKYFEFSIVQSLCIYQEAI